MGLNDKNKCLNKGKQMKIIWNFFADCS